MLRLVISSLKMYILWRIGVLYLCQWRQNVQFLISPQKLVSLESKHVKFWCNPETGGENQYQSDFAAWGKLYTGFDFKGGKYAGGAFAHREENLQRVRFSSEKNYVRGGGKSFCYNTNNEYSSLRRLE